MSKNENIAEEVVENVLSEEQIKEIEEHKRRIKEIKYMGSFKMCYVNVRKGLLDINKSKLTEAEKKNEAIQLLTAELEKMTAQ